ncbi:hypothetical protein [Lacipirellula parvula]|uniref:Uncharacterized protein n=1 Tax=Lacipirellula parvula TaxID=2650471 RepID=A0A5K7X1M5_9BACT|nr:hypothetical protein [Lacipirellula parvula]BBO30548.1 hypothetical protein PLANPX_0160 [Lacipirellula parvula]
MRFTPSKRLLKRLALGFAITIGLLLMANGVMAWRVESRLQARLEAIRAAGDPASIADLAPAPLPNSENAAAYIEAIRPQIEAFSKEYGRFYAKTALGKAYDKAEILGELPTAEQAEAMRAILNSYPLIDQELTRAAACEQFASRGDFTVNHQEFLEQMLDRLSNFRAAARYVAWQCRTLLQAGEIDAAVEKGVALLRLSRLHDEEPLLVSYLVSIAVRGVAIHELYQALNTGLASPEVLMKLETELARQDDPHRFARMLRSERGYAMNTFDLMPGQDVNPFYFSMVSWPMKQYYLGASDHYDALLKAADGGWDEFRSDTQSGGSLAEPTGHGVLADLLMPAMEAAVSAEDRNTAMLRSLRAFNSLLLYKAEHGREASGLAELGLPAAQIADPLTGKPLIAKHTDRGWIIYSVGTDGVDDGGEFAKPKDFGVGPPKLESDDKDSGDDQLE